MITLGTTVGALGASIPPATLGTVLTLRDPGSWTTAEIVAGLGAFVVATLGVLVVAMLKNMSRSGPTKITLRPARGHVKDAA
jgi:hypothetical protein